MNLADHYGEIKRREHYQGIALLAAISAPTSQIVTVGHAEQSDSSILELLLSDTATAPESRKGEIAAPRSHGTLHGPVQRTVF